MAVKHRKMGGINGAIEVAVVASGPACPRPLISESIRWAYFANSAIWRQSEFPGAAVVNVLGLPVLGANPDDYVKQRRDDMRNIEVDRCIVPSLRPAQEVTSALSDLAYGARSLEILTINERELLTRRAVGRGLVEQSYASRRDLRGYARHLRESLRARVRKRPYLPPASARVSTGVFALAVAATEHPNRAIWVSGVSFTTGDTHLSSRIIRAEQRGHLPADLLACRRLARRHSGIYCSDPEVCDLVGWQLHDGM